MSAAPPPPPPKAPKAPPPPSSKVSTAPIISGATSLSAVLAKRKAGVENSTSGSVTDSSALQANKVFQYFQEKSKSGYVGLSNQGATCYMNSVLQSLFMTPEFRSRLYKWRYDSMQDGPEEYCIPLQLQKLFARLQLGKFAIAETKALTKSFRWSEVDAFQQNDIQEFLRLLFDALEICLSRGQLDTAGEAGMTRLYQGEMTDYIQCTVCMHSRIRRDAYLDLPLVIRDINSVDEAIRAYISPEVLTEGNRWECPKCQQKVDALKGFRFHSLPYFLTIYLKRFDYDTITWRRIKLNNKVTFSTQLDMSKFVTEEPEEEGKEQWPKKVIRPETMGYELFSVLVHSGGAMGGHYYTFVKDFKDNKWFKFNDASVTEVEAHEVEQMYGGDNKAPAGGAPSGAGGDAPNPTGEATATGAADAAKQRLAQTSHFSTNAYMLMYRLVNPAQNLRQVVDAEVPQNVVADIEKENEEYEKAKAEWVKRRDAIHLTIFHSKPTDPSDPAAPPSTKPTVPSFQATSDKNCTLSQALDQILQAAATSNAGLPTSDKSCVRIRPYNPETGTKGLPWEIDAQTQTLEALRFTPTKAVYLETRLPHEQFPEEQILMVVKAVKIADQSDDFEPPVDISINLKASVADLQAAIATHTALGLKEDEQRVFFSPSQNLNLSANVLELSSPDNKSKSLNKDFGVVDGSTVHLERKSATEAPSRILLKFEENANKIQLFYNLIDSREVNQELAIDKRKTIAQLKDIVAPLIGLQPSEFKVCKGMLAKEFKEENKSLHDSGLFDGSAIVFIKGTPIAPSDFAIKIFLYNDTAEADSLFREILTRPFAAETPIDQIREILTTVDELQCTDPKLLRIRVKKAQKAGNILFDGKTLKESVFGLKDGTELCVQVLSKPETLVPGELVLQVRQWFPSKQELGTAVNELVVHRESSIVHLKIQIEKLAKIDIPFIAVTKPFSYQLIKKDSSTAAGIAGLNWHVEDAHLLTGSPWYLQDGDILLFKDDRDPEVESKDGGAAGGSGTGPRRALERALKIYTIYDAPPTQEPTTEISPTSDIPPPPPPPLIPK